MFIHRHHVQQEISFHWWLADHDTFMHWTSILTECNGFVFAQDQFQRERAELRLSGNGLPIKVI